MSYYVIFGAGRVSMAADPDQISINVIFTAYLVLAGMCFHVCSNALIQPTLSNWTKVSAHRIENIQSMTSPTQNDIRPGYVTVSLSRVRESTFDSMRESRYTQAKNFRFMSCPWLRANLGSFRCFPASSKRTMVVLDNCYSLSYLQKSGKSRIVPRFCIYVPF